MKTRISLSLVMIVALGGMSAYASSIVIDSVGDSGTITSTIGALDALLFGFNPTIQGVGNSKVFLTVDKAGSESGYNTDGAVEFDTTASGTTSLKLSDIPLLTVGGTGYYEFAFAVNQTGNSGFLSLNQIQLFQASSGNLTGYPFSGSATPRFDWASNGTTGQVLDFISGVSNTEMLMLVPAAAFGAGEYVYLYMNAGAPFVANGGSEKWVVFDDAICPPGMNCTPGPGPDPVPEPSTLLLLCTGVGLVGVARRKSIAKLLKK